MSADIGKRASLSPHRGPRQRADRQL